MFGALWTEYDCFMQRFLRVLFSIWFAISMTLADVFASAAQTTSAYPGRGDSAVAGGAGAAASDTTGYGYVPDQRESQALTQYLTKRKLPLVGAQVLRGPDGRRMVVLYGFVGSDFGKSDAVKKARHFVRDTSARVDNRINVRPELLASSRPVGGVSSGSSRKSSADGGYASGSDVPLSPGTSSYPGPDSYLAQRSNPYVQQFAAVAPLALALLGVLGMGLAGGNSSFSFGSTSPYGGSPYGFGGSPFGSPYGGPPFGSPYGGSSAYGPSYPYP